MSIINDSVQSVVMQSSMPGYEISGVSIIVYRSDEHTPEHDVLAKQLGAQLHAQLSAHIAEQLDEHEIEARLTYFDPKDCEVWLEARGLSFGPEEIEGWANTKASVTFLEVLDEKPVFFTSDSEGLCMGCHSHLPMELLWPVKDPVKGRLGICVDCLSTAICEGRAGYDSSTKTYHADNVEDLVRPVSIADLHEEMMDDEECFEEDEPNLMFIEKVMGECIRFALEYSEQEGISEKDISMSLLAYGNDKDHQSSPHSFGLNFWAHFLAVFYVVKALKESGYKARLILFDSKQFSKWCKEKGHKNSTDLYTVWAAEQGGAGDEGELFDLMYPEEKKGRPSPIVCCPGCHKKEFFDLMLEVDDPTQLRMAFCPNCIATAAQEGFLTFDGGHGKIPDIYMTPDSKELTDWLRQMKEETNRFFKKHDH